MRQYYVFDNDGYFTGDILADEAPDNVANIRPPQPCWNPRWDGAKWIEEAPPPEHNPEIEVAIWDQEAKEWNIKPKPLDIPSVDEQLRALQILLGVET